MNSAEMIRDLFWVGALSFFVTGLIAALHSEWNTWGKKIDDVLKM